MALVEDGQEANHFPEQAVRDLGTEECVHELFWEEWFRKGVFSLQPQLLRNTIEISFAFYCVFSDQD